jgi:hypothetical protein
MKLIKGLVRRISTFIGRKEERLETSKLVGLYLSQTNGKDGVATDFNQSRQRRNGKYSHNRERA